MGSNAVIVGWKGDQRRFRFGRDTSSPPQFGQVWFMPSAHGAQKVHS
jgi:hypothetical protein